MVRVQYNMNRVPVYLLYSLAVHGYSPVARLVFSQFNVIGKQGCVTKNLCKPKVFVGLKLVKAPSKVILIVRCSYVT